MHDTRKPVRRSLTLVAFTFAVAACQLFVDLDGLEDRACPPGRKACGDGCVSESDPATGCNDPLCNPCAFSHANAICDQRNRCSFTPEDCIMPWAACDVADDNGCEIDLAHDKDNCGKCRSVCPDPPHGTAGCSDMNCVVGKCDDGWEDCDLDPSNGCEVPIWTDMACVSCRQPCPSGMSCDRGVCREPSDGGVD
jgi:hypothetical protein